MRKAHLLPNFITAFSLSCGLFIIFKTNMTDVGGTTYETLRGSAILLLLAAFADTVDGAVARAIRAESPFGGVFDSLADAITFGVVPPVIMLKSLSVDPGTKLSFFAATGAMVFSLCGVMRLVRFSTETTAPKGHFTGLPIPSAAMAAVSMNLFLVSPEFTGFMYLNHSLRVIFLSGIMILLAYFMVSRWKFPSFKALELRLPSSFHIMFLTVTFVMLMLFGLLYHFSVLFVTLSWTYIFLACGLSGYRVFAGRDSKTLESFEPDEET